MQTELEPVSPAGQAEMQAVPLRQKSRQERQEVAEEQSLQGRRQSWQVFEIDSLKNRSGQDSLQVERIESRNRGGEQPVHCTGLRHRVQGARQGLHLFQSQQQEAGQFTRQTERVSGDSKTMRVPQSGRQRPVYMQRGGQHTVQDSQFVHCLQPLKHLMKLSTIQSTSPPATWRQIWSPWRSGRPWERQLTIEPSSGCALRETGVLPWELSEKVTMGEQGRLEQCARRETERRQWPGREIVSRLLLQTLLLPWVIPPLGVKIGLGRSGVRNRRVRPFQWVSGKQPKTAPAPVAKLPSWQEVVHWVQRVPAAPLKQRRLAPGTQTPLLRYLPPTHRDEDTAHSPLASWQPGKQVRHRQSAHPEERDRKLQRRQLGSQAGRQQEALLIMREQPGGHSEHCVADVQVRQDLPFSHSTHLTQLQQQPAMHWVPAEQLSEQGRAQGKHSPSSTWNRGQHCEQTVADQQVRQSGPQGRQPPASMRQPWRQEEQREAERQVRQAKGQARQSSDDGKSSRSQERAASGIKTFRDKGGYWDHANKQEQDPKEVLTLAFYQAHPQECWEWHRKFYKVAKGAAPNPGHLALQRILDFLRAKGKTAVYCTQNIDDLHNRATAQLKSKDRTIYQVHGNILQARCEKCQQLKPTPVGGAASACNCGHPLRPHTMFFDQSYSQTWNRTQELTDIMERADLLVLVGTSIQTGFVTKLAGHFAKQDKLTLQVGLEQQVEVGKASFLNSGAEVALPTIFQLLKSIK